ncbi:unnamed protein product [Allacma fusca]|uniref:Uncharacterized protein n=1 Tax=Allacma fusca TaxID=39272 RepID=A0A8J2KPF0_9HEXA|nr:unnamed protein product [Allacma fusca]
MSVNLTLPRQKQSLITTFETTTTTTPTKRPRGGEDKETEIIPAKIPANKLDKTSKKGAMGTDTMKQLLEDLRKEIKVDR